MDSYRQLPPNLSSKSEPPRLQSPFCAFTPFATSSSVSDYSFAMKVSLSRVALGLVLFSVSLLTSEPSPAQPASPFSEKAEFTRYAERLRESVLQSLEPQSKLPSSNRPSFSPLSQGYLAPSKYPWHGNIVTTIFWVGESASVNNPVHNRSSSWDLNWRESFGGFDNPERRRGYLPVGFVPKLNPFYCALPYNDVSKGGFKPEAPRVIPWFRQAFVKQGQSVCRDRWIQIRSRGKSCYAQWSDCGPFRTDHWEYVFGNQRPSMNLNKGAGLDVSPAVRDFLGLGPADMTDWRFVEFSEVPKGPWSELGENNDFVQLARRSRDRMATTPSDSPRVLIR
jgi:hypothetical protein